MFGKESLLLVVDSFKKIQNVASLENKLYLNNFSPEAQSRRYAVTLENIKNLLINKIKLLSRLSCGWGCGNCGIITIYFDNIFFDNICS